MSYFFVKNSLGSNTNTINYRTKITELLLFFFFFQEIKILFINMEYNLIYGNWRTMKGDI